ncbi:upstream stimulatory factor 1-like isoform X2 [Paramacrobiotus metropolitanus]|uniref:upstream stimulatory factor 1-like isoform X2 n=1 Tax=Paramacrobiotus metropolitanus TaxID=2943436 RepID=UPI002445C663|nr:upstream stimulatory factor 1-like isoform X2 [Paramacrobiotus metropolitanus]
MDHDEGSNEAEREMDDISAPSPYPYVAARRTRKSHHEPVHSNTVTTLEPAVTIVRGEADGTTTYYKIISTTTPGASALAGHSETAGGESMLGKVQLINGSLHFPNGTVVVPSTQPGEILNNSDFGNMANANLLSTQPTMVSVSIPGGAGAGRYRSITIPDLNSKQRKSPALPSRDERRRQTHNEVERRRRDKINQWISKLQAIVPNAAGDNSKHSQSKGVVLSKAVDYISLLHEQLAQMRSAKDNSQKLHLLAIENEVYKKQADVLKNYIHEKGLELPPNMPTAALNALQELQQGTAILIAQQTRPPSK